VSADAAPRTPTPLAEELCARIRRDGPISVAAYMDACLHHPVHGYYRKRDAIGRSGDFITAPEISQVFGELIGLWCAVVWRQMGEPRTLNLIELGPGRGTLMCDALRAARTLPAFRAALSVDLVESNPTLEAMQRATLANMDVAIRWSAELASARDAGAAIVIANEFLDTLPLAQWVHRGGQWHARYVGCDAQGRLAFVENGADPDFLPPPAIADAARDGDVFETRARTLETFARQLTALADPIVALFIDYGHVAPALGDTLQAVRGHRYDDPLRAPGEADLSAQVDFSAVATSLVRHGLLCDGPVAQAELLGVLGIAERASRLMAANPADAGAIEGAIARLMAPGGMGTRFQALGARSKSIGPLPGLATVDSGPRAP